MFKLGSLAAILAGGLVFAARPAATTARPDHDHAKMEACAKACADCMRECEMCQHHCVVQLAAGKKEHQATAGTCADCGDVCAAAAKVVSRNGPLAAATCEGCAKVCDGCAVACEKFPDDEHMKKCAKAYRDCAKACREMVGHH